MFIKRKKNRSGTISVVVAEKNSGIYKELVTIGIAKNPEEVTALTAKGYEWIDREQERRHPRLDLFGEERKGCEAELLTAEQMLSCITNISINGADLILDRVFDSVGFNRIEDPVLPDRGSGVPAAGKGAVGLSGKQGGYCRVPEKPFR